jgi:hypothetical protein
VNTGDNTKKQGTKQGTICPPFPEFGAERPGITRGRKPQP